MEWGLSNNHFSPPPFESEYVYQYLGIHRSAGE